MDVIHFTHGATDPLQAFAASGASFLPLLVGDGPSTVSCLHLEAGGRIDAPSTTHPAGLLVVHGRVTLTMAEPACRIDFSGGVGAVFQRGEAYAMAAETSAIILIVEAGQLSSHARGISCPSRIKGQRWPGECARAVG